MEKEELVNILSEILVPTGFKKKGNYWVSNSNEITKMVNLQKSQFGNSFYINYGYILKSIPLEGMMHIYNRVASKDGEEQQRIIELLDFENDITNGERSKELKKILLKKMLTKLQAVNTEEDLLNELSKRSTLNDIPLIVKKHFCLE